MHAQALVDDDFVSAYGHDVVQDCIQSVLAEQVPSPPPSLHTSAVQPPAPVGAFPPPAPVAGAQLQVVPCAPSFPAAASSSGAKRPARCHQYSAAASPPVAAAVAMAEAVELVNAVMKVPQAPVKRRSEERSYPTDDRDQSVPDHVCYQSESDDMLTCSTTGELLRQALACGLSDDALPEPLRRTQDILQGALDCAAEKEPPDRLPNLRKKRLPPMHRSSQDNSRLPLLPTSSPTHGYAADANDEASQCAAVGGRSESFPSEMPAERLPRANRTPLYVRMQRDYAAQEQQQCARALQNRQAELAVNGVLPAKDARPAPSGRRSRATSAKKKPKSSVAKRRRAKAQADAAVAAVKADGGLSAHGLVPEERRSPRLRSKINHRQSPELRAPSVEGIANSTCA